MTSVDNASNPRSSPRVGTPVPGAPVEPQPGAGAGTGANTEAGTSGQVEQTTPGSPVGAGSEPNPASGTPRSPVEAGGSAAETQVSAIGEHAIIPCSECQTTPQDGQVRVCIRATQAACTFCKANRRRCTIDGRVPRKNNTRSKAAPVRTGPSVSRVTLTRWMRDLNEARRTLERTTERAQRYAREPWTAENQLRVAVALESARDDTEETLDRLHKEMVRFRDAQ